MTWNGADIQRKFEEATTLHQQGRFDLAQRICEAIVRQAPRHAEALLLWGVIMGQTGLMEKSVSLIERAIRIDPALEGSYGNLGAALMGLKRFDQALRNLDQALAQDPESAELHYNRGLALSHLNRFEEALASFDRAVALHPGFAAAHWNYSLALLTLGRFEQGWPRFEWRLGKRDPNLTRSFRQPVWSGSRDLAGKTVFLHWEQGLGDTIQFCRYALAVRALGARVVMSVQDPLVRLLRQFEPLVEIVGPAQEPSRFDAHCALMSLPLAFGTTLETIPAAPAYLAADPALSAAWAALLPPRNKPRIGLVWRGSTDHGNDRNRSIDLKLLRPLLALDATWVCLQKDLPERDLRALRALKNIQYFGDRLTDFAETAALIDQLDLVISVDTSVAHLAGTLGKPVWVLLPFIPDWRWLLERSDSPWYPSARLFRQTEPSGWPAVIAQVKHELAQRFG